MKRVSLNSSSLCLSAHLLFSVLSVASGALSETNDVIRVSIALPSIDLQTNETGNVIFERYSCGGLPGQPDLPIHVVRILLPPDVEASSVQASLVDSTTEVIGGTWNVAPAPLHVSGTNIVWPEGVGTNRLHVTTYSTDALTPPDFVGRVTVGQMREWQIATVVLWPFRYNPVSRDLIRLANGTLRVDFRRSVGRTVVRRRPGSGASPFEQLLRKQVVNFNQMVPQYEGEAK